MKRSIMIGALITAAISGSAFADDAAIRSTLEQARALYNQRSDDLATTEQAIQILAGLEGKASEAVLNYEVLVLESRAYYWKGGRNIGKDAKIAAYLAGKAKAEAAVAIDKNEMDDNCAEAHYYAGINLGKWGLTNGPLNSLRESGKLVAFVQGAKDRETCIDKVLGPGQPGEQIDGYGPDRTLGKMYKELPGINPWGPVGSRTKSLFHLERALAATKDNANTRIALNVVYLAGTLATENADKPRARQLLDQMISALERDVVAYNPNRAPENREELKEGKDLRSAL